MFIARVRADGQVRLGVVEGDGIRLIEPGTRNVDQSGPLGAAGLSSTGWSDTDQLPLESARPLKSVELLMPIPGPGKILCVGLNYRKHAAEGGLPVPEWPEIFGKFSNSLANPGDEISIPAEDADVDYEVELCAVVGRRASHLAAGTGLAALAGYTVANDVSARKWQLRVKQWMSGKMSDGFCPTGPWLATASSIADPQNLRLWTEVNGHLMQNSSTNDMVFGVAELVVYLSSILTLEPGDLILTGTPEGVGLGKRPPVYLKPGDHVRIGVDGIGELENVFQTADRPALDPQGSAR